MKPSISRKMDMVKDVFLKNKKLEESITFAEFVVNNQEYYDDFYEEDYSYPQLLIEGKSKIASFTRKFRLGKPNLHIFAC